MQKEIQEKKQPRILLVANVSKEHVLKFHIPTIKLLTENGWHVDVACSGEETVPYCNHQFKMSYKRSPFNLALFKGVRELKKIVRDGEYDIVYCHTPVGALAARLAARKARKKGTKVVYMAHGFHFFKGAPVLNWLLFYPMEKMLSFFTDSIILINREDYERARTKLKHRGKTYLINGIGVDLSRFKIENREKVRRKYREELHIPQDATVLVYLAELIANKNQKMLMNVVKSLLEKGKNVYLVLAGVDHTEGEFLAYANQLGIDEHFRYLGWRSDVANIYAMADICTASSIREGFGVNIVEAMTSGLPVVATDNRGHGTIIQNGENGFLVPIGDEELFAQRVSELMTDCILQRKIVESASVDLSKYSTERATGRIREILAEHL